MSLWQKQSERIDTVCKDARKSGSQGGLNIDDMTRLLRARGHRLSRLQTMNRRQLVNLVCDEQKGIIGNGKKKRQNKKQQKEPKRGTPEKFRTIKDPVQFIQNAARAFARFGKVVQTPGSHLPVAESVALLRNKRMLQAFEQDLKKGFSARDAQVIRRIFLYQENKRDRDLRGDETPWVYDDEFGDEQDRFNPLERCDELEDCDDSPFCEASGFVFACQSLSPKELRQDLFDELNNLAKAPPLSSRLSFPLLFGKNDQRRQEYRQLELPQLTDSDFRHLLSKTELYREERGVNVVEFEGAAHFGTRMAAAYVALFLAVNDKRFESERGEWRTLLEPVMAVEAPLFLKIRRLRYLLQQEFVDSGRGVLVPACQRRAKRCSLANVARVGGGLALGLVALVFLGSLTGAHALESESDSKALIRQQMDTVENQLVPTFAERNEVLTDKAITEYLYRGYQNLPKLPVPKQQLMATLEDWEWQQVGENELDPNIIPFRRMFNTYFAALQYGYQLKVYETYTDMTQFKEMATDWVDEITDKNLRKEARQYLKEITRSESDFKVGFKVREIQRDYLDRLYDILGEFHETSEQEYRISKDTIRRWSEVLRDRLSLPQFREQLEEISGEKVFETIGDVESFLSLRKDKLGPLLKDLQNSFMNLVLQQEFLTMYPNEEERKGLTELQDEQRMQILRNTADRLDQYWPREVGANQWIDILRTKYPSDGELLGSAVIRGFTAVAGFDWNFALRMLLYGKLGLGALYILMPALQAYCKTYAVNSDRVYGRPVVQVERIRQPPIKVTYSENDYIDLVKIGKGNKTFDIVKSVLKSTGLTEKDPALWEKVMQQAVALQEQDGASKPRLKDLGRALKRLDVPYETLCESNKMNRNCFDTIRQLKR